MANHTAQPLHGWIPYKLNLNNNDVECHWLDTFNAPYLEPFFDETISKLKGIPHRKTYFNSVSGLAMIEEWSSNITEYVEPTAFIFHVSRCGSTLISQLLSTNDQNIVLPEVPFFDDLLRLPYKGTNVGEADTEKMLRAALRFYGQKRTGNEQRLFIKADSWHIFFYKQLRKLYLHTPFILLYRAPNEVFDSHIKQRGIHTVPGLIEPQLFGFDADEVSQMSLDVYLSKVLEQYYSAYLKIAAEDKNTLLVNYSEGIMPVMDKIASFIQVPFSCEHYKNMQERANYHSKHPGKVFSEIKNNDIQPVLQKAFALYQQTEQKRLSML